MRHIWQFSARRYTDQCHFRGQPLQHMLWKYDFLKNFHFFVFALPDWLAWRFQPPAQTWPWPPPFSKQTQTDVLHPMYQMIIFQGFIELEWKPPWPALFRVKSKQCTTNGKDEYTKEILWITNSISLKLELNDNAKILEQNWRRRNINTGVIAVKGRIQIRASPQRETSSSPHICLVPYNVTFNHKEGPICCTQLFG